MLEIFGARGKKVKREFYTYNAVGTVVANTDISGNIIKANDFDAFGIQLRSLDFNTVSFDGSYNSQNDLLFSTKERDASTGLDCFGFRYYDSEIGRFTTRDPSGYPDGANNQLYTSNNPINFIDPLGLMMQYQARQTNFKGNDVVQGMVQIMAEDAIKETAEVVAALPYLAESMQEIRESGQAGENLANIPGQLLDMPGQIIEEGTKHFDEAINNDRLNIYEKGLAILAGFGKSVEVPLMALTATTAAGKMPISKYNPRLTGKASQKLPPLKNKTAIEIEKIVKERGFTKKETKKPRNQVRNMSMMMALKSESMNMDTQTQKVLLVRSHTSIRSMAKNQKRSIMMTVGIK